MYKKYQIFKKNEIKYFVFQTKCIDLTKIFVE